MGRRQSVQASDGPVRIVDVAERAGVAVSTVSRALSNHPDVSKAMRERVLAAAEELGYSPDPTAQSLKTGETRLVGFVVRDLANPFFAAVIHGVEEVLDLAGYALLATSGGGDPTREALRVNVLRQRRVDALLFSSTVESDIGIRRAISSFPRPVVLIDRDLGLASTGIIRHDHAGGVRAATEDLIALGHKRIALIIGTTDILSTRQRIRGYHEALEAAGLPAADELLVSGASTEEFASEATDRLLSLPKTRRPTAIISGGVEFTLGMLRRLNELGVQLGDDLSVVVCDDLPWLRVLKQTISTVERDGAALGRAAARLALNMINGGSAATVELPTFYASKETSQRRRGR